MEHDPDDIPLVYLSGPITLGDPEHNFNQAAVAQRIIMRRGAAVMNPMLSMRLPGCGDFNLDQWMRNDLPWIAHADAILRLPGQSAGADIETRFAASRGIPVFYELTALLDHLEVPDVAS